MGREARKVPPDWGHPRRADGSYVPLYEGDVAKLQDKWDAHDALWSAGEHPDQKNPAYGSAAGCERFEDWDGGRPRDDEYMPNWPAEQRTKWVLYETTTEGTPCINERLEETPKFDTLEELAAWAEHNATTFSNCTATAEAWLSMLRTGLVHATIGNATFF